MAKSSGWTSVREVAICRVRSAAFASPFGTRPPKNFYFYSLELPGKGVGLVVYTISKNNCNVF